MSTKYIKPMFSSGGFVSITTAASGTDFTTFSSQSCSRLTVSNNSGTTIEVQQGGAGISFPVYPYTYYTFSGISNMDTLGIRRVDVSTTQVIVSARWES